MSEQKPFKRKQVLIDKNFQLKFILRSIIPLVVVLSLSLVVVLYVLSNLEASFHFESTNELITMLSDKLGQKFQSSAELFSSIRGYLLIGFAVLFFGAAVYVTYIFLYFSHRIAGPIMRFERGLRELHEGNLTVRIHLRKKDEFQKTAQTFNEMSEALEARIKRIKQFNDYTLKTIEEMKKHSSEENKKAFEKLEDLNKGIAENIDDFKIG